MSMPIRSAIVLVLAGSAATSAAAAEPTSDSLRFEHFATIDFMGRIDVNASTGEIAVGTTGPGNGSAQQVRVVGTDGSVRTLGSAVPDPDSVVWDVNGVFSAPGSILAGGVGGIFSIDTAGTTTQRFGAGIDFANPEDMTFTAAGELLIADYNNGRVQMIDAQGRFATVAVSSSPVVQVAASHATGEVLFADQAGTASDIGVTGRLLSAGENAFFTGLAFGDGSARWGDDAYAVNRTTGELMRFGDSGSEVIASGLFAAVNPLDAGRVPDAEIGFLPGGDMVVAVPMTDTIWRVVPTPGTTALLALGGLTAIRRRR